MNRFLVSRQSQSKKRSKSPSYAPSSVAKKSKLFGGAEGQGPKKKRRTK